MKMSYISKKNLDDLDIPFIFERLQLFSPYGEKLKKSQTPYKRHQVLMLESCYDQLEAAMDLLINNRSELLALKSLLKEVKLLDHTFDRIAEQEVLSMTELFEIKQLVKVMESIRQSQITLYWQRRIKAFELSEVSKVIQLLDPEASGVQAFHIYSNYSSKLYDIRKAIERVDREIKLKQSELIEQLLSENFPVSKQGELKVMVGNVELIQRVKNDSRLTYKSDIPMYSVFTVKQDTSLFTEKQNLLLEEEQEEYEVRSQLTLALMAYLETMVSNTEAIGQIDLLIAKAQFSVAFHCVRPVILEKGHVEIEEGRHLKVAHSLEKVGKQFTPINVSLKKSVTLITGANMGGKTVSLKMIGQVVSLAQYGFFVPCKKLKMPLFDFIFVSVGDFQSIDMGLSTFGGEIVEIEQAIKRSDEYGLILIDELARGTNPLEGFAISKALIEFLTDQTSKAVITTHFDGLTEVKETIHYQVKGLSDVDLTMIREKIEAEGAALLHEYMDYQLVEVSSKKEIPKEAIRISELMGLDTRIVNRAKEILGGSNGE